MSPGLGRLLLSAALAVGLGAVQQQPKTSVVIGRVVEGLSDVGVADAMIAIRSNTGTFSASALTSSNGDFVFANVPAGTYGLQASRAGSIFGEYGQRRVAGRGRSLVVADQHITDIRMPVWKYSAVSGVVVDDIGEPVTGINVQAMGTSTFGGHVRMSAPYRTAPTDDRGVFRLSGLIPGVVALSISAAELATLAPRGSRLNASGEPAYGPAFFPAGVLAGSASTLILPAGEERRGINFRLQLMQTRRVTGRVTGAGDVGGILVRLVRATDRLSEDPVLAETVTQADGAFTFDRVIPGEYVARVFEVSATPTSGAFRSADESVPFSAPRPARTVGVFGASPVVVGDANVDNVNIALQPTARITGDVVFNGSATKPQLQSLSLYLQPWLANGRTQTPRPRSTVDPDFHFRSGELPPGDYLIRWGAGVLPDWAIESITRNGTDALDRPITVGNGDADGVVVTLTDRISEVTGVVRKPNNAADADAAVIVFPVNQALWSDYGLDSPRLRYVRVDANGVYRVRALPAGDYLAVALDDALTEPWATRAFLEQWSRSASRFSIAVGAKHALDLRTVVAK